MRGKQVWGFIFISFKSKFLFFGFCVIKTVKQEKLLEKDMNCNLSKFNTQSQWFAEYEYL